MLVHTAQRADGLRPFFRFLNPVSSRNSRSSAAAFRGILNDHGCAEMFWSIMDQKLTGYAVEHEIQRVGVGRIHRSGVLEREGAR